MAELAGFLSAIAGLVSIGLKVAKTLSDCVDEMGNAGTNIYLIATDTKMVSDTLRVLMKSLKNSRQITTEIISHAQSIFDLCERVILEIRDLLPILPEIGQNVNFVQKARWLFAKSKITTKRTTLDSLKLTLNLFLQTIDLIEGDANR